MPHPEHVSPPLDADAVQAQLIAMVRQLTPETQADLLTLVKSVVALEQAYAPNACR